MSERKRRMAVNGEFHTGFHCDTDYAEMSISTCLVNVYSLTAKMAIGVLRLKVSGNFTESRGMVVFPFTRKSAKREKSRSHRRHTGYLRVPFHPQRRRFRRGLIGKSKMPYHENGCDTTPRKPGWMFLLQHGRIGVLLAVQSKNQCLQCRNGGERRHVNGGSFTRRCFYIVRDLGIGTIVSRIFDLGL